MSGHLTELHPARDQALRLLDQLCDDSLECSLSEVLAMSDRDLRQSHISSKFKWLHDLIVMHINA